MDVGRVIYLLARVYVAFIALIGVGTVLWLLTPTRVATAQVAGIWFAVSGFGALVLVTVLLVHFSRE
ncbi:MAG: hypothetical protein ABEI31_02535 [Halodesulfurarchaeum sp.]